MRPISLVSLAFALPLCALPAQRNASTNKTAAAGARELLPEQQVQHVLNRLAFGPRPGDAAKVRAMGVERWIDAQLHPERIDDATARSLLATYPSLSAKTADLVSDFEMVQQARRQAQRADSLDRREARQTIRADSMLADAQRDAQRIVGDLQSAKLAMSVTSERQLYEVMVDFWENHFSVFAGKGQTRLFLADYDQNVIRPHALGRFRDLLGAVAKSPAMLFYLDNWQSAADSTHATLGRRAVGGGRGGLRPGVLPPRAGRGLPPGIGQLPPAARQRLENATPEERQRLMQQLQQRGRRGLNENYARELMELHTLGVDGGYSQKDVQEVARALTGWTFIRADGRFTFNPAIHDADEKVVLGRKLAAGRGIEDGEDVLDMLAKAPQTARYITTKLARYFVSDDPPKSVVDRCAPTFTRTDGDILETVRCVVTSPEFFSPRAYRAKVKTPFQVVASALRALGAQPDPTPRTAQIVARLGQPIFGRQTPDGWPDRADAWMNTGAILNRINFGLSLAAGQVPTARLAQWPEMAALRNQPREAQVDGVVKTLLGGEVSNETRQVLMSGENPMLAKAGADSTAMVMDPDPPMGGRRGQRVPANQGLPVGPGRPGMQLRGYGRPVNLQGLPQIVGLALGAPEFQRR
jgi:uncharacterized protein (DUF1800 family)